MASKFQGEHCTKIIYDWKNNFTEDELKTIHIPIQDNYKLCIIELNEMYRSGESPVSDSDYDYILSLIEDEDFKNTVGTGLNGDLTDKIISNIKKNYA